MKKANKRIGLLSCLTLLSLSVLLATTIATSNSRPTASRNAEEEDNFFPQGYGEQISVKQEANIKTTTIQIGNKSLVVQKDLSNDKAILLIEYSLRNREVVSLRQRDLEALTSRWPNAL